MVKVIAIFSELREIDTFQAREPHDSDLLHPNHLLPCFFSSLESFTSLIREAIQVQGNKGLFTELAQENPIDLTNNIADE